MDMKSLDTLSAQCAEAWRLATAMARAWSLDSAGAVALLAGPAQAETVARIASAALARAAVTDEVAEMLRGVASACAVSHRRRQALAERYRAQRIEGGEADADTSDWRRWRQASAHSALLRRAETAERIVDATNSLCRALEHALDCDVALDRAVRRRGA